MATNHRELFAELVRSDAPAVALDRAALLIAAEEYEDLSIERYLAKLDELAERVASSLPGDAGPHETLGSLRRILVDEERFTGNTEQYYDPRNSYLNDVLDRHMGIPIALSTIYIEVARRIGFTLHGVGFPGHFLVKHASADEEIVLDPFHDARILAPDELKARLEENFRGKLTYEPNLLASISTHQLLFRMLSNLKSLYVQGADIPRALAAVERMLLVAPDKAAEHRDRGVLLARLERPIEALAALAKYRELSPDCRDADDVQMLTDQLKTKIGMAN